MTSKNSSRSNRGGYRVAVRSTARYAVPRVLPGGQAGRLGAERHVGDGGPAAWRRAPRAIPAPAPARRADRERGAAEQEPAPGQPARAAAGSSALLVTTLGFQWKVKLTRCGFSHTSWYSTWRADTGGETSRVSWYVPGPGRTTSLP